MLHAGQPAPEFALPDADMQTVDLASFKGKKNVVLYFYPKDGTPGCTMVTTDFSDHEAQFQKHDCVVLGVSRDDCLTHADFRDRNGVTIGLLSDPEGEVCRKYGVIQEKELEGQRRESLVDLQADPGETTDLATDPKYREILVQHRELLRRFAGEQHDPLVAGLMADDVKTIPFPADHAATNADTKAKKKRQRQ